MEVISATEKFFKLLRERYSIDAEISIIRQKDQKPQEFEEYYNYCEWCKQEAKKAV